MIFSGYNREDGLGSGDLYMSYRDEKLGKNINSAFMDYYPFVGYRTMTLCFTSRRSAISEDLTFEAINPLIKALSKTESGMSVIYSVSIKDKLLERK
ncbi:MAG: hypothetical protein MK066_02185 [Crocinitomicaceae bacterium]|nr:hypothetical protein [Crocinitomicaceae bacterium]